MDNWELVDAENALRQALDRYNRHATGERDERLLEAQMAAVAEQAAHYVPYY